MSAIINSWDVVEVDGEPTVKDTDLAERLGFERPRNIRNLIKRMVESGSFGGALPCSTEEVPENGGKIATVYHLNEKQALKVISKSETKKADEIMDEVIDVFLAFRSGKLQPQQPLSSMQVLENFFKVSQEHNSRLEILEKTKRLEGWQEKRIKDAVNQKVFNLSNGDKNKAPIYRTVWRILKNRFTVARYSEIPSIEFEQALDFVNRIRVADLLGSFDYYSQSKDK